VLAYVAEAAPDAGPPGSARAARRAALEEHLDRCAECRRVVSALCEHAGASAPSLAEPGLIAHTLAPGQVLCGRYAIARLIAVGGMGEVYEADDRELGERVAIKAVRHGGGYVAQLRGELQLARRVTHPNVCRVFDLEIDRDPATGRATVFFTMELIRGETLSARLAAGPAPLAEAAWIADGMIAGLAAAHDAGVLHRDFKSANVLLGARAERAARPGRVVVSDFGVARAMEGSEIGGRSSRFTGTPAYLAPERAAGHPATVQSDVYSLGVVLYELVTGRRPPRGGAAAGAPGAEAPAPGAVVPPSAWAPEIPARWDAAIARCLAAEPAARFSRVEDVAAALRGDAPARRRPRWIRAAALTAASLALATGAIAGGAAALAPAAAPRAATDPGPALPRVVVGEVRFAPGAARGAGPGAPPAAAAHLRDQIATELARVAAVTPPPIALLVSTALRAPGAPAARASHDAEDARRAGAPLLAGEVWIEACCASPTSAPAALQVRLRLHEPSGAVLGQISESGTTATATEVGQRVALRAATLLALRQPPPPAPARDPETRELVERGQALASAGDLTGARRALEAATARAPGDAAARVALARVYLRRGQVRDARHEARTALASARALTAVDRLLVDAVFASIEGQWERLEEVLTVVLRERPADVQAAAWIGQAWLARGQPQRVREHLARLRGSPAHAGRPDLALLAIDARLVAREPLAEIAADVARLEARADAPRWMVAMARASLASALHDRGPAPTPHVAALAELARGEALLASADTDLARARSLGIRGQIALGRRELDEAREAFRRARDLAGELGEPKLLARMLNLLAHTELSASDRAPPDLAHVTQLFASAGRWNREIGAGAEASVGLGNAAATALEVGDRKLGTQLFDEAFAAASANGAHQAAQLVELRSRRALSLIPHGELAASVRELRALWTAAEGLSAQARIRLGSRVAIAERYGSPAAATRVCEVMATLPAPAAERQFAAVCHLAAAMQRGDAREAARRLAALEALVPTLRPADSRAIVHELHGRHADALRILRALPQLRAVPAGRKPPIALLWRAIQTAELLIALGRLGDAAAELELAARATSPELVQVALYREVAAAHLRLRRERCAGMDATFAELAGRARALGELRLELRVQLWDARCRAQRGEPAAGELATLGARARAAGLQDLAADAAEIAQLAARPRRITARAPLRTARRPGSR
jgi:tetratricopeptide (TPR) repeat protein